MAHILSSSSPTVNIDYPVGAGATNRRDDVMLVQGLLLTWAWERQLFATEHGGSNPVKAFDLNAFRVDGHFGDKTRQLLRLYATRRPGVRLGGSWIDPLHIEVIQSAGKPFNYQTGSNVLGDLAQVSLFFLPGYVDTARGKYQPFGLFCLGWDMPPTLAASLARRQSKPHYTLTPQIDI